MSAQKIFPGRPHKEKNGEPSRYPKKEAMKDLKKITLSPRPIETYVALYEERNHLRREA